MNKYWQYLKYLLEHKKNVFKVCIKRKMYIHAITHDLSKFSPTEFIIYAKHFYGTSEEKKNRELWDKAWAHHIKYNKHHWQHWLIYLDIPGKGFAIPHAGLMPKKYVKQMVCDWEAMGIKFNDSAIEYYNKNKDNIKLCDYSQIYLLSLIQEKENKI